MHDRSRRESEANAHDPRALQVSVEQLIATGPDELPILQLPRTASSGRRLIAITLGGS